MPKTKPVAEQLDDWLPSEDRQAYRTAAYTVALALCAGACGIGLTAIYHLLTPFLLPILWATLVGTMLFPLKQGVTSGVRNWLEGLRTTSTPLTVGFIMLPLTWLDTVGERLWSVVTSVQLVYVVLGYSAMKALTYEQTLVTIIGYVEDAYNIIDSIVIALAGPYALPFVVMYTCAFFGWLYIQPTEAPNKKLARVLSLPIWLLLLSMIACAFGWLRVPIFIATAVTLGLIAGGVIRITPDEEDVADSTVGKEDGELETTQAVEAVVDEAAECKEKSETIMYFMASACVVLFCVRHTWLLSILLAPMLYVIIKKIVLRVSASTTTDRFDGVRDVIKRIVNVCVPHTMRNFVKLAFTGDQSMLNGLSSAMDGLSTVIVIIGVFVAVLLALGFVVVQVHAETLHTVKMTGSLLGKMQEGGSEWVSNFTDTQLAEHDIDAYVEQGVLHAKTYLTQQVRQLSTGDASRADDLERQVVDLVDRVVKMWNDRNANTSPIGGLQTTHTVAQAGLWKTVRTSFRKFIRGFLADFCTSDRCSNDLWTQLTRFTDVAGLKQHLIEMVQENVTTVRAVAESLWGLISANLSVIGSLLVGTLGLVLNFGMELVNFLIQLTVFLTLLYHLLSSSTTQWKPFEWMALLDPTSRHAVDDGHGDAKSSSDNTVTVAFETAVKGVFVLSAQMATFYGMYVWFIHTLFALNVVFVPAVVAFLLAIVPLAPPCSVCVIGILELWLSSGELAAAVVFALLALAPMMLVEDAFYRQLKGTHPYVTGMSVIGGMYWMGLQGALVGPIILCCCIAMANLAISVM